MSEHKIGVIERERERETEGEMMIHFANAVTGQVLAVNSALRTEGCMLAWRCVSYGAGQNGACEEIHVNS